MRSPGTVVPDGGSHAVSKRLVDYGHRHHATLPFVNIAVSLHDLAAVEPVHDFIGPVLQLITNDRHRITVLLDALVEQLHFGGSYAVRVIGIGTYLVQGNAPDFVNGGLIGGFHKILRYLLTAARRRAIAPLVGPNPAYLQK